jgi:hypothetical protein
MGLSFDSTQGLVRIDGFIPAGGIFAIHAEKQQSHPQAG